MSRIQKPPPPLDLPPPLPIPPSRQIPPPSLPVPIEDIRDAEAIRQRIADIIGDRRPDRELAPQPRPHPASASFSPATPSHTVN